MERSGFSAAVGSPRLSYQWYFHGVPIAGQTGPTGHTDYALRTYSGIIWCVVTNPLGSAESDHVGLTVLP